MQKHRAKQILQALIQGIHPETGEPLTAESPLQSADVLRALLAGISALELADARANRRAQLPKNVGEPWTNAEVERLRSEFGSGVSLEEIAQAHGRTVRAIANRLMQLGLIPANPDYARWTGVNGASPGRKDTADAD
jgi:hypothetical protein